MKGEELLRLGGAIWSICRMAFTSHPVSVGIAYSVAMVIAKIRAKTGFITPTKPVCA